MWKCDTVQFCEISSNSYEDNNMEVKSFQNLRTDSIYAKYLRDIESRAWEISFIGKYKRREFDGMELWGWVSGYVNKIDNKFIVAHILERVGYWMSRAITIPDNLEIK